ncbi:FUSC family protein [Clostridium sp.]|uniref:FUSC family protein n=1 Tax=Clostridium sp. TaxID=1506 RepID=UPI002A90EA14|nr:FUSC family protein [Clostridium sp.]MDY6013086.1 FUSC family protein [Clostridium sp.]
MSKKLIISQTILFIFIMAFVLIFKGIFGAENTLIGVATITAMLMLLQKDLTLSPVKNTILLVLLNLLIGAGATIADKNMWVAIPINLIITFILTYTLSYNLAKPVYLPFSLEYLFLLTNPVSNDKLGMRFLALIVGAIMIMVIQLVVNRNNVLKRGNKLLVKACDDMIEKLKKQSLGTKDANLNSSIEGSLSSFRQVIYNKREQQFYLTEESRIKLNIAVALEKMSALLDELDYKNDKDTILAIEKSLEKIKGYLNDESTIDEKEINAIKNYDGRDIKDITALKVLNNMSFIYDALYEIKKLDKNNYNLVNKIHDIPEGFKLRHRITANYNARSAKFSYAVRFSIGMALSLFIMDYLHIVEARWIAFTIQALVTPVYEMSKTKTKDRLFATVCGVIIVEILFHIFKDVTSRSLILMLSGYISGYIKQYRYNLICITISAMGSAALLTNTNTIALYRIVFVVIGTILAILINKFILPYDMKKDNKMLKLMYYNVVKEMLNKLKHAYNGKEEQEMSNLFIVTSFISERLKANNIDKEDSNSEIIANERNLICSIYELYMKLKNYDGDIKLLDSVFERLIKEEHKSEEIYEKNLEKYINGSNSLDEKLVLSNMIEVYDNVNKMKNLTA